MYCTVTLESTFWALLRGEPGFSHKEYKGTPPANGSHGAVSRVLSVAVKGDQVYVELKSGPGKLTNTGAITPNGRAEVEVNVTFKLYEARRMAATVMAYLQAWDVLRMLAHKQAVGQPTPFTFTSAPLSTSLLVATASENNGVPDSPSGGVAMPSKGSDKPHSGARNGRPVTRKDVVKADGASAKSVNGSPTGQRPFQYGNGTLVDEKNLTEVQTFQRYQVEKQAAPESKGALLDYYRQRMQAVGS